MKKYYVIIALFIVNSFQGMAQQRSCVYTHPTSTNPNNPFNLEYLGYSGSSVNSFENSFFNWYPNSNNAIYIDPSLNWVIPQFQNPTPNHYYSMIWPWDANTMPSEFSYLSLIWNPNIGINGGHEPLLPEERDFRWEDGWELLWLNLGYLPNGDDLDNLPSGSLWTSNHANAKPFPNNVPYFILYNKYRGTLRVFANVWDQNGNKQDYDDLLVRLEFPEDASGNSINPSGLLRNIGGLDKALDKPTDVTRIISPRFQSIATDQWLVADFQLSYDPCICDVYANIQFVFEAFNVLQIDGVFNSIGVDQTLNEQNYQGNNFLNLSDLDENNYTAGSKIYPMLSDMWDDYADKMIKYNQDLLDYNNDENQLKITIANIAKDAFSTGVTDLSLIPVNSILDFIKTNKINFSNTVSFPADKATGEWSNQLNKAVKKVVADEFDFFNATLGVSDKPTRPQAPAASFTEGAFKGKITDKLVTLYTNQLTVPGTTTNITANLIKPSTYPAYNNLPGLFALLETPKMKLHLGQHKLRETDIGLDFKEKEVARDFYLQFDSDLIYAFNNSLDFDFSKTEVFAAVKIVITNYAYRNNFAHIEYLLKETNFKVNHRFVDNSNCQGDWCPMETELISEYYNIRDLKNILFRLNLILKSTDDLEGFLENGEPTFRVDPGELVYEVKSIQLKLAADMYFNRLGFAINEADRRHLNTFQVFTYELYNIANGIELETVVVSEGGNFMGETYSWINYSPGLLVLSEDLDIHSYKISEIDGSSIYIRAENVLIEDGFNPPLGYQLFVEALNQIKVSPTYALKPNTFLRLRDDFYKNGLNSNTIITDEFLYDENNGFCARRYNANIVSNKVQQRDEEFARDYTKELNLQVSVYPNPASSFVQIAVQNQPQTVANIGLALFDVAGRQVLSSTQPAAEGGRYLLNLPELSAGGYVLHVTAGDKTAVEKILIQ